MKSVLEVLKSGADHLAAKGVSEARLSMEHLLAKVLGCKRLDVYLQFDRPLDEQELEALRELLKRRIAGEPVQHLLGSVEFRGREFISDKRALVPRPETEELVELVLARLGEGEPVHRVVDVGCGSGVLGLTLALDLEGVEEVVLTDLSPDALALAEENRLALCEDVEDGPQIRLVEGDLLAGVDGAFGAIVSNLPYIPPGDITGLSPEVQHDPVAALDGGDGGTAIMQRLIASCSDSLEMGGLLAMEFGIGQAEELAEAAGTAGFVEIEIAKDTGGIDRFLLARRG